MRQLSGCRWGEPPSPVSGPVFRRAWRSQPGGWWGMPSATPDAEVPVYRIEHTMPDLRIPAAYRANAAADTADLPIITPDGDRDDPGGGAPRRRQQWGRDRSTRAMEVVPKPVSDRRVA